MALAMAAMMVLGCAACGGGAEEPAAEGGNTVVVAIGGGFATLDPGYVYEKNPTLAVNACYDTLFKFVENDGAAEPWLVDTYEFSEDGMTLTMTLKDGVVFASGNPMTSADVAFSINRTKNLQSNPAFLADTIASVETPDDKTVVLNLTQPDAGIMAKLAYVAFAVLDSAVVKENGGTDAPDAVTADT
ncbi:MAG: ABC transporter substrate-binding protein, partial [Anaerotignum sp.]|nr:ABC transporter substrate-binding protein [Anaerotignum sp.]